MAKLYLNPAARIPNEVDISGRTLSPAGGDAVVTPSAAYPEDFYLQTWSRALSGGADVPTYTSTPSQLAAMLYAQPGWMLAPQLASDPLENLGTEDTGPAELMNGATLSETPLMPGTVGASFDGVNDYVRAPWPTRVNYAKNPYAAIDATGATDAGTTGDIRRTTELPSITSLPVPEITTGYKVDANGGADGGRIAFETLGEAKTYTVSFYMYRADSSAGNVRVRIENNAGTLVSGTEVLYGPSAAGAWFRHTVTFTTGAAEVYKLRIDQTSAGPILAYVTAVLCELGSTVKSYFPLPSSLANGTAVPQGTLHNSVVDYGPFARSSGVTMLGMSNRTKESGNDNLIAVSGSEGPRLILTTSTESKRMQWRTNRLKSESTYGGERDIYPGNEQNVMWAAIYSDPGDYMQLGVNGPMQAAQTGKTAPFVQPDGGDGSSGMGEYVYIGNESGGGNQFKGFMLPVAIYPRVLDVGEIANIYAGLGWP